jgi:hypothetical protein
MSCGHTDLAFAPAVIVLGLLTCGGATSVISFSMNRLLSIFLRLMIHVALATFERKPTSTSAPVFLKEKSLSQTA